MKLNIPHKCNTERRWRKVQREFLAQCRPFNQTDFRSIVENGIGQIESVRFVYSDPVQFMDKRQRRRQRRRLKAN